MTKIDIKEMKFIQRKIIRMLKNKKKYGGAHTETIHLKNCVPRHLRGQKVVDEAISDLFKKDILINKKSVGEQHCSLNNEKLKEINEIEN
jgi:hypothetical protein